MSHNAGVFNASYFPQDGRAAKTACRVLTVCLSVLVCSVPALGAKIEKLLDDFLITKWTTEEGLPQNTVTSIVQTRDGYLWLGTFGGLARFDGVRFTVFDTTNTPTLKSNRVLSLYEDSRGRLWIGSDFGEVYVRDETGFRLFPGELGRQRISVWSIIEDGQGNIYLSSDSGLERYSFDEGGNLIPGSGLILSNERTYGLFKHPEGSVWVRIQGRIFRIENDTL